MSARITPPWALPDVWWLVTWEVHMTGPNARWERRAHDCDTEAEAEAFMAGFRKGSVAMVSAVQVWGERGAA